EPRGRPAAEPDPNGDVRPDRLIASGVVLVGAIGIVAGLLARAYVEPFPWRTAVLVTALAVATRPLGIPLPGKGFASFVVSAVTVAVVLLGWPAGALVAVVTSLAGDAALRRLPPRGVVVLA
ncbi:MAG: hypothetical protein GWN71_25985, partial [Gammaproteobacteria bacterium]|nr:hypothetical protein [Gemmatimonadota bacterium]NIU76883.1 hypothetical protein [Gammaproteobacteria bacterium]